jgi:hypothetical protein
MRALPAVAVLLLACACASHAERHVAGCSNLDLSMTRQEVIKRLGPPDRTEAYIVEGKPVVYLFYLTRERSWIELQRGNPPMETDYTPLLFKDDRLQGWGACLYNNLRGLRPEPGPEGRGAAPVKKAAEPSKGNPIP